MKKYLLPCLLLLFPFVILAQDAPALYKDFYNGIKGAHSFVWDDHINIMQVNTDNDKFDIVAVNDQMQILWKTSLEGFAFTTQKFRNKIVAVASTDHSTFKGNNNTYKAYMIDPATGKMLVEKVIYNGTDDYMEYPAVFTGEGAYFKFCIRKSGFKRTLHVAFLGNNYEKQLNETSEYDVLTMNEKLETLSTIKLPISNGTLITVCANKKADLFAAWLNGPSIEVYQYPDGSSNPVKQLNASIEFKPDNSIIPSEYVKLLASPSNNNILYYGITYSNQDKDVELGIGKFDFSNDKKLFVTEAFNKDHVKLLEKGFVPVNKKINDVSLGSRKGLQLRYMAEVNGGLITTVTSQSSSAGAYGSWMTENSVLINGYDENLNTRFQQILPTNYSMPNSTLPFGYHVAKNKFYVVSNNKTGVTTLTALYGCLDLSTGKWDKMEELSKKKIGNGEYSAGGAILWFSDNYIVPYFAPKGLSQGKVDVVLQQNSY